MTENTGSIEMEEAVTILGADRAIIPKQWTELFDGNINRKLPFNYTRAEITKCAEENESEVADWYLFTTLGLSIYKLSKLNGKLNHELPQLKVDYPYDSLIINCIWENESHEPVIFLVNGMPQMERKEMSYVQQAIAIVEMPQAHFRIPPGMLVEFAITMEHLFKRDIIGEEILITDCQLHYCNRIAISNDESGNIQAGNIHMCAMTGTRLLLAPNKRER